VSDLHDDLSALALPNEPPEKKKRPTLLLIVIAAVVVSLGALVMIYLQIAKRPVPVKLAEASLKSRWAQDIVLIATGHIEPRARASAAALAPGRVKKILVEQGALVAKGDVVAELDPVSLEASLKEARASLNAAKAKVKAARRRLAVEKKKKKEKEDDSASVGAAASALSAANAEVKANEARIDSAKIALQHAKITAPMAGTVWKIHASVGQSLSEDKLQVLDLVDLSTLYVDADVSESKLGVARVDMPADVVLDAFPTRHIEANVAELRPEVNKETSTGVVRLRLASREPDVLVNMAARVSFLKRAVPMEQRRAPPQVSVPVSAVVERDGTSVVFAYAENGVAKLAVVKGETFGSEVEIKSGLKPGDRVVLSPPETLEDGRVVELIP
jgi:HlyD family secretion protein